MSGVMPGEPPWFAHCVVGRWRWRFSQSNPLFPCLLPTLYLDCVHSCVPSPVSKEAWLIGVQTLLLVSRTVLTEWIARLEGVSGSALVCQVRQ